jgi:hypothetical protein
MDVTRYPAHWEPGQLLNVRQFSDGSRVLCLLHEDPEREETQTLTFDNAYDTQEFVAWWYAPASALRVMAGTGAAYGRRADNSAGSLEAVTHSATGVPDIDPEVSSSKRQAQRGSGFSAKSSALKGTWSNSDIVLSPPHQRFDKQNISRALRGPSVLKSLDGKTFELAGLDRIGFTFPCRRATFSSISDAGELPGGIERLLGPAPACGQ